jgi:hypothetical protein
MEIIFDFLFFLINPLRDCGKTGWRAQLLPRPFLDLRFPPPALRPPSLVMETVS